MYFAGAGALDEAAWVCASPCRALGPSRGSSAGALVALLHHAGASARLAGAVAREWNELAARALAAGFDDARHDALRAVVHVATGSAHATMRAAPGLELLAWEVLRRRPVLLTAATCPEVPLALALLGCTASALVSRPVRIAHRDWELVDVELLVPPRVLERSFQPRSWLCFERRAPLPPPPVGHPAARQLQALARFPFDLLDGAANCQTAFCHGAWPSSSAGLAIALLLVAVVGVVARVDGARREAGLERVVEGPAGRSRPEAGQRRALLAEAAGDAAI
jgi:hypothetical protein